MTAPRVLRSICAALDPSLRVEVGSVNQGSIKARRVDSEPIERLDGIGHRRVRLRADVAIEGKGSVLLGASDIWLASLRHPSCGQVQRCTVEWTAR